MHAILTKGHGMTRTRPKLPYLPVHTLASWQLGQPFVDDHYLLVYRRG